MLKGNAESSYPISNNHNHVLYDILYTALYTVPLSFL